MPTIEIDLIFFLVLAIVSFLSLPFIIGWTMWKSYRNPEFWLRLRRQDWVYPLVRNPLNSLVQVALPLSRIGENGEFRLFKNRRYYWTEHDKEGRATTFQWRHKKAGALYAWNDPYPQAWVPGNSLSSITDPRTLDDINELKAMKMMMNADSMTQLMKLSLIISITAVGVVAGLAFALYSQTQSLDHVARVVGNLTGGPSR